MSKIRFLFILACGVSISGSASAQSLTGRWMTVGGNGPDSRFAQTYAFGRNGSFQYEMAVAGRAGSGDQLCRGNYQFDGQYLVMRFSACNGGALPGPYGGPVEFLDQVTFRYGDSVYRRQ